MWIAALSDGGFEIHQCPRVSDILKNWRMSDSKPSATLGCHDSWKQHVSTGDVPEKIQLQFDVRLAQKCADAMLWLSTRSRPDLSYCGSRLKCFFLSSSDKHVPVALHVFFVFSVMEGGCSSPFEFPRVLDDEELDGDMSLIGTGGLSGYGADGDTRMFGSWRSTGCGHDYGDMIEDGLSQAITPFVGGAVQGRLGSGGPIMSPSGICRVCEHVVSGFHYVHYTSNISQAGCDKSGELVTEQCFCYQGV